MLLLLKNIAVSSALRLASIKIKKSLEMNNWAVGLANEENTHNLDIKKTFGIYFNGSKWRNFVTSKKSREFLD